MFLPLQACIFGLIYSARAVDDLCHALHPGSRQPTLSPPRNCCLSFTDCVGVSRQSRYKTTHTRSTEKDSKLSKFLRIAGPVGARGAFGTAAFGCLRTKYDFAAC